MELPLTPDELHRVYYWLNRQRLMERRTLGDATLRDLEECEERVHRLWLEARSVVSPMTSVASPRNRQESEED